ncbi:MAG: hypothetical protein MI919_23990, partial [Holophagales bacterium]|nr:hypothetical protein [Holophagales bacterium]
GASVIFEPPGDPFAGVIPFQALPFPDLPPAPLFLQGAEPFLILPPAPPLAGDLFGDLIDPERGRLRYEFQPSQQIQPGQPFDLVIPVLFPPDPAGNVAEVEVLSFQLVTGAPAGFSEFQPLYMGQLGVTQLIGPDPIFSVLDFTLQATAFLVDPLGQPDVPLSLNPLGVMPIPGQLSGLELSLQALVLPPPSPPASGGGIETLGGGTDSVRVDLDVRLHAAQGAAVFADGFENGDLLGWSSSTP